MRVFDFDHAIVREPGRSVVDGLRGDPKAEPSYEAVRKEHSAYVAALRAAGLSVDVLPPLENFPDSMFVEDPALVLPEGAILLRPGTPTRVGEAEEMRPALMRHFDSVLELKGEEYADGGDVLVTPGMVFIGLSKRTNRAGAEAIKKNLALLGREARIVETRGDLLHLKSGVSLPAENAVLTTRAMADTGIFSGLKILLVPDGEEGAANSLRVNDTMFVGARFPKTIAMLRSAGYNVAALPVTEINKLDGGLSCLSLRWRKRR